MPGPYNFESQKVSARNLVLTANKQAAYGTAVASADMLRRQKFDGSAVLELKQTRYSDKALAGKGTEFATQGQVTAWDSSFNFKADLDDWLAGWAFAFALGKDTITGAGPYLHTFAFDETTTQACATSIYLQDTAAVERTAIDMAISELTLTIPARGPLQIELALIGTGHWTNGAIASLPALANYAYLLGSDCVFSIGPQAGAVSKLGRHMQSTIKISTGVQNHTAPGLGLYGAFPRTGLRKVSFQTTIAAQATDDIETLLENDTVQEANWTTTSGTSILAIDMPCVHLKSNKLGTQGNMVVWQFEGDETTIFNQGGAGIINPAVTNSQATAYLIGA